MPRIALSRSGSIPEWQCKYTAVRRKPDSSELVIVGGLAGLLPGSMNNAGKIRRITRRTSLHRTTGHQRVRVGIGLINTRPSIRTGANIQLAISAVCVGGE